jgi:hypothetical protein
MPELLTNVLAEHTYDPVRSMISDPTIDYLLMFETLQGPDIGHGSEVCEQFQENTSRYVARRLQAVHGRTTFCPFNVTDWIVLL